MALQLRVWRRSGSLPWGLRGVCSRGVFPFRLSSWRGSLLPAAMADFSFFFNSLQNVLFCLHRALSQLRLPTTQRSQQDKLCLCPFCGEGLFTQERLARPKMPSGPSWAGPGRWLFLRTTWLSSLVLQTASLNPQRVGHARCSHPSACSPERSSFATTAAWIRRAY